MTTEVLKLYDAVRANEDVFGVDARARAGDDGPGLGADREFGTGEHVRRRTGGTVHDSEGSRGRCRSWRWRRWRRQLQELWELSEQGTITVDETTQALLNQAEAQGIVGASMRDANKQILDVLVEIRDCLPSQLPRAIARTGSTRGRGDGPDQPRDQYESAKPRKSWRRRSGRDARDAAQTGQLAVLTGSQQEQAGVHASAKQKPQAGKRTIGPGMTEAARTANAAIDTIAQPADHDPDRFRRGGAADVAGR